MFGSVQRIEGALTSILQKHIRLPVLSVELFVAQADAALTAASQRHKAKGAGGDATGDAKRPSKGAPTLSGNSSAALTNRLLGRFTRQAQQLAEDEEGEKAAGGGGATARPRMEVAAKFRTHVCPQEQGVLFFTISSVPMPYVFAPADGGPPKQFASLDSMQQYMARKGVTMEAKQASMVQAPRVRLCRAPQPEMAIALSSLHVGSSVAFELDKLTAPELRAKFAQWTWDGILPLTPMECGWADVAEDLGTARGGAARVTGMRLVPVPPSVPTEDLPCPVQSMRGHMDSTHTLMWAFQEVEGGAVKSAREGGPVAVDAPPAPPSEPKGERSALFADLIASRGSPEAASSLGEDAPPNLTPGPDAEDGPPPEPWKNSDGIISAVPGCFDPRRVLTLSSDQLEGLNVQGFDFPVALWLTPRELLSPSVVATGILGAAQLLSEYTKASCWHSPGEHTAPFDITELKLGPLGPPPLTLLPVSFYMERGATGTPNDAGSALLQLHELVLQFTAVGAAGEQHSCQMYLQRLQPSAVGEGGQEEQDAMDRVTYRCVKVGAGLDEISSANVWRAQESVFMLQELLQAVCEEGDCLRSVPSGRSRNSIPTSDRVEEDRMEALGILNARVSDSTSLLLTKYSTVVAEQLEEALPRSVHAAVHAVVAGRLLQRQQLVHCLEQVGLRVWPTWRLLNRPAGSASDKAAAAKQAAERSKAMQQKVTQLRAKKLVSTVTGQGGEGADAVDSATTAQPTGGSAGSGALALNMGTVAAAKQNTEQDNDGSGTAHKLRQAELQQAAAGRIASKMQKSADAAVASTEGPDGEDGAVMDELSSDTSLGKPKGGSKKKAQSSAVVPAAGGDSQDEQDAVEQADSDSDDEGALSAFCRSCIMACSDGVQMQGGGSEGALDFLLVSVPRHVMEERAEHLGMRVRVHPKDAHGAFLYEFDEDNFLRGAPMQPFWRNSLARPYPYEGYFQEFSPAQRHTLLLDLITRARASAFGFSDGHRVHLEHASGGADINFVELTAEGVIADYFPLHDSVGLHGLQRFWVHAPTSWMDIPAMYYTRGLLAQLGNEALTTHSARKSARGILGALVQNRLATCVVVQQLTGRRPMHNWARIVSAVSASGKRKHVDVVEQEEDAAAAQEAAASVHARRAAKAKAKGGAGGAKGVHPASNPLLTPEADAAAIVQQGALDDTSGSSISTMQMLHAIQADTRDLPDDGLHLVKRKPKATGGTAADLAAVITVRSAEAKTAAEKPPGASSAAAAAGDTGVSESQAATIRVALVGEIQSAKRESERRRGACTCCCFRCTCCSCCGKQSCVDFGAWWTWWWNVSLGSSLYPPLHLIRGYFGTQPTFYFLFLRVYTAWLALPALYGVLVFISPYLFDTGNTPVVEGSDVSQQDALVASYAILTVLWATLMIETMQHQQSLSAYKWGVGALGSSPVRSVSMYSQAAGGVQADEDDNGHSGGMGGGGYGGAAASQNLRGEFIADMQGDDRDDSVQLNTLQGVFELGAHPRGKELREQLRRDISTYNELYFFPADSRRWRYVASTLVVLFMIGLVVALVAAVLILPGRIFNNDERLLGVPLGDLISGVANGLVIPTLSFSFSRLAVKLTRFERHPYQNDYDASLTLKLASFTFVNSYISLFILAFYIQDLDRLGTQLGAIMITGQVVGTVKESGIMWALDRYRRLKNKKVLARLSQMFSLQSGGTVGLVSVSRQQTKPSGAAGSGAQVGMVQGNTGVLRIVAEEQRQQDRETQKRKLRHFARFAAAMDSDSEAEEVATPVAAAAAYDSGSDSDSDSDNDDSVLAAGMAMQMLVRQRSVARAAASAARERTDTAAAAASDAQGGDAVDGSSRLRSLLQRSRGRAGGAKPQQGETAPQLAKALRSIVRLQKQRKRQVDVYDSIKLSGLHTAITEVGRQQRENMLEEYMEMITQFGFVALFAAAFPLAAAASLLNNFIEIRSDAQKMLVLRRSFARDTSGIGIWLQLMKLISLVSVFTNIMLIYISTSDSEGSSRLVAAVAGYDAVGIIQVFVVAEHLIIALKLLLRKIIPDTPAEVVEDRYRERYFLLKAIDESARVNKGQTS